MTHTLPCPLVGKPGAHDCDPHTISGCECPHDEFCPSAYTFGVCECPLIARVRADERTRDHSGISVAHHTERLRENYAHGYAAGIRDVEEVKGLLREAAESPTVSKVRNRREVKYPEAEAPEATLLRHQIGEAQRTLGDAGSVYEQGYSLRDQVEEGDADSSLKDYKEVTSPSDWAGHVAAHTDDPALVNLFRACDVEWGPGFADFDDDARSARDIKVTPIGRALLNMVEKRLESGGVPLPSIPNPRGTEQEQNLNYEVETLDASDTHVPWCKDVDCGGCVCMHANTLNGVCEDCGEEVSDTVDSAAAAEFYFLAVLGDAIEPSGRVGDNTRRAVLDALAETWGCFPGDLPESDTALVSLMHIHRILHRLYPGEGLYSGEDADAWMVSPNEAFDGQPPIYAVLSYRDSGLNDLHYFLSELEANLGQGDEDAIRASVGVSRLLPPNGHAPWCRDLECWGCECDHLNISQGVCEDCGEPSAEPALPEAELEALRDAARTAANEGRYALRTCWVCNPAHEHLRSSDCLIECFGCGDYYYRGVRITDDSDGDNSEISEGEAIFDAGRVTGVLDSIKAITEAWEAHKGGDWGDAAQAFTLALDALLVTEEDGGDN